MRGLRKNKIKKFVQKNIGNFRGDPFLKISSIICLGYEYFLEPHNEHKPIKGCVCLYGLNGNDLLVTKA